MIASLTSALAAPATVVAHGYDGGRGHYGGGFFLLWPLFTLFWILLVWFAVGFLLRRSGRGGWGPGGGSGVGAEAVLHERYARGELDEEEYRARLEVLRTARRRR